MKYLWLAAVLGSLTGLTGCQVPQDDRDFFYSGWVKPEEGANLRMYGTKKAPGEYDRKAGKRDGDAPELPTFEN